MSQSKIVFDSCKQLVSVGDMQQKSRAAFICLGLIDLGMKTPPRVADIPRGSCFWGPRSNHYE
jgi:hypothetical protein